MRAYLPGIDTDTSLATLGTWQVNGWSESAGFAGRIQVY